MQRSFSFVSTSVMARTEAVFSPSPRLRVNAVPMNPRKAAARVSRQQLRRERKDQGATEGE